MFLLSKGNERTSVDLSLFLKLLFNFFEALNGKPLEKKYMNFFHSFGFFILISLMIFATYNDISRFL